MSDAECHYLSQKVSSVEKQLEDSKKQLSNMVEQNETSQRALATKTLELPSLRSSTDKIISSKEKQVSELSDLHLSSQEALRIFEDAAGVAETKRRETARELTWEQGIVSSLRATTEQQQTAITTLEEDQKQLMAAMSEVYAI